MHCFCFSTFLKACTIRPISVGQRTTWFCFQGTQIFFLSRSENHKLIIQQLQFYPFPCVNKMTRLALSHPSTVQPWVMQEALFSMTWEATKPLHYDGLVGPNCKHKDNKHQHPSWSRVYGVDNVDILSGRGLAKSSFKLVLTSAKYCYLVLTSAK